ncbi:Sec34-domain-containing protein [Cylindrobasidium torrendii FP15055 ss-10]|uniref:Conserved oligomeric Golgi complex subunit 3 n=1 Tax=Cylindrobasidium torrendii FP15055 ss-10 TaxID=1314674 RepID=A0A0D7BUI6_9AGAR|nr:Sec34-domain-containing protein [Cylindrobasidium torrendii FP15055 ss-10]
MAGRTPRRVPALNTSPAPRPTINLEEWEAKAPLGDAEIRSVGLIKAAAEKLALPPIGGDDSPSRPSTPKSKLLIGPGSRPGTPNPSRFGPVPTHALHPKLPVQTPQQFYDWFAVIDKSVAHSQEAHFRAHVAVVADHLSTCDYLLERIGEVEKEVDQMLEQWTSVEESGKSLKDACERLLEERDHLLNTTDEIGARLEYFQELEHATRMLNHPGESLVLQADFLYMVERVDICIDYLKSHRHFREAEVYLLRFQQCMTRAMTLIKMFFVGSLRALSADISKRLFEKDVSSTAQMHLLYTRFRSVAPQLGPLLRELERRAVSHPDELMALLSECHTAYLSTRKSLLINRLMEEIKGLDPTHTELVELTRAGCSYLKQLCLDEYNTFREFFSTGEDQLYQYLENICDYLYDDLRPRILHEPRLTALCEVCTVLQALMVLDDPDVGNDDNELNLDLDGEPKSSGWHGLHISQLLEMVLQDAQTRLVFKAQSVIQTDIRYYVPKAKDLAYPEKLIEARKPASATDMKEKEIVSQIFRTPSLEKQDTWYPTLQKTVWVLSQLHDYVKPAIFEDIAQEALTLCQQSLVGAVEIIKVKNPPTSVLDAHLFLARHLLIMKEVTNNLDFLQRDYDPSVHLAGMTDALSSMLSRTSALLPGSLFSAFTVPTAEGAIGSLKQAIDQALRQACADAITECASPVCTPLREWVDHMNEIPSTQRPSQADAARSLRDAFVGACGGALRANVMRLSLYLESDRTVGVLVGHVEERIVDEYSAYRNMARSVDVVEGVMDDQSVRIMVRDVREKGVEQTDSSGS